MGIIETIGLVAGVVALVVRRRPTSPPPPPARVVAPRSHVTVIR